LDQTDGALTAIDGVSVDLVYINRVRRELEQTLDLARSGGDGAATQWNRHQALKQLADLFVAVNGASLPVHHLNLYDMRGNCVGIGSVSVVSDGVDLAAQPWYSPALKADGYKIISKPFLTASLSTGATRPQYFISLVRLYTDENRTPVGFIEAIQRCSIVFGSALALNRSKEQAYIVDADGSLVYPYPATDADREKALALKRGGDAAFLARPVTSAYTGWTYIVARARGAVLQPVYALLRLILGMAVVMMLLIALFAFFTARRMTRPLTKLGERMRLTDAHSLSMAAPPLVTGYREVSLLQDSFEQMRKQLNASMAERIAAEQQALKSRNLAMQAQINPHFYYNTLSSIIALTDIGRPDDVVSMCRSLTGMMRYVTGPEDTATLGEELNYVGQYLYCMKMRYDVSFDYEINVSERLLHEMVPRLIIQPFVENALKYGINCPPPWKLQIIGEDAGDAWRVVVLDNGPGFPDKALTELKERMRLIDLSAAMPDVRIDGMGILNVYARWKLFAGAEALFEISKKPTGGYAMIGRERRSPA
jgi:two-component system sensor histidine kinase YesM